MASTIQTVAAFAIRDANRTGSQPACRIGPASAIVSAAKQTMAIAANSTPGPTSRVDRQPPSATSPVITTPPVTRAAPRAWSGVSVSPRSTTASTTVTPPYAETTGDTTETGPIRSAVKNAT